MELGIRIKMNEKLFLRNPEDSPVGRKIVKHAVILINKIGFEEFNFKKLSVEIKTTEATIYRYFENKHRLLVYLFAWYWSFLEYKIVFETNNVADPEVKLRTVLRILASEPEGRSSELDFISESELHRLVMLEGSKAYLTRQISKDNKDRLFKPYKDLCERFSAMIREVAPRYRYSHSLASCLIETAHVQRFFSRNLPSLTDFSYEEDDKKLLQFLEGMLFNTISA